MPPFAAYRGTLWGFALLALVCAARVRAGHLFADALLGDALDVPQRCAKCDIDIAWDSPMYGCSLEGDVIGPNALCPPFGGSLFTCYIRHRLPPSSREGFSYPGVCGCPNNCFEEGKRGHCNAAAGVCECNDGWGGADCSTVDCSVASPCMNGAMCARRESIDVCVCPDGYSGDDCSVKIAPWPEIPQLVPSPGYSEWEKYGDDHPVFNRSVIGEVKINLDADDLKWLLDPQNMKAKKYMRASFYFNNGVINDTIQDVGFRTKGGISRTFAKKTFKISFNTFEKGRKWYSMKKLDVRAGAMDVSFARDTLSMSLLRSMGGYVQRASFMRMKVNDIDFGTQLFVENIDERYLKSRFERYEGALYKCQGDLAFLGFDPENYRDAKLLGRPMYIPKTDAAEDFSQLALFITIVNHSPDATFEKDISSVFDVDLFLRTYAFDVLGGQYVDLGP
eukprot:TRINITY_DN2584_c0_g1_i2.p1 TRINITY_DN2584_c0_g1~~TRINITY_DN2584_c0_g1_i2.p1  ORF type:complete len:463 (-),score=105.18 TRINITY_DN2584_c0_g1_i2:634-1980(-)